MIYNVKLDENNYVVDLTRLSPAPAGYQALEVGEIPGDVMCGYYQLIDGIFVLDEAKKAQWEIDNPPHDPFSEA